MLAEGASDLCKRQILRIVAAQSQTIARRERRHRCGDTGSHQGHIARAPRIDLLARCGNRDRRFIFRQRIVTSRAAQPIDVPLREHSAQPGGQTAAAMKVAEMRAALAVGTRVIMVTGYGSAATRRLTLDEGAAGFLAKPFSSHELLALVRTVAGDVPGIHC